jgi:hypothetical protein
MFKIGDLVQTKYVTYGLGSNKKVLAGSVGTVTRECSIFSSNACTIVKFPTRDTEEHIMTNELQLVKVQV